MVFCHRYFLTGTRHIGIRGRTAGLSIQHLELGTGMARSGPPNYLGTSPGRLHPRFVTVQPYDQILNPIHGYGG